MPEPWSAAVPPNRLAQTKFPLLSSLETKTSLIARAGEVERAAPGSKSAVPLEEAGGVDVARRYPQTMLKPWSLLVPPNCLAQTKFPLLSSLETKTS